MPLTERQQMAFLLEMTAKEFKEETDKRKENNDEQESKKSAGSSKSELSKIHKRNKRGETPLHLAAIKGDIDSVQNLIRKGADVNVTDHAGWSPLHEACSKGHYKIVKILLKAGADANARGLEDDTPLHDACSNDHVKVARILLKYGADPRKRNDDLETPLDLAASSEISDFLEEYLSLSDAEKEKFGLSVGSMPELSSDDDNYSEENVNRGKEKDNNAKQIENDNDNNNKQEPDFITKLNKDTDSVTDSSDDYSESKSESQTAEKSLVDENLDDDDECDFLPRKRKRRSNSFSKRILSDDEEDESLAFIRDEVAKERRLQELERALTLDEESKVKEQPIASQSELGHTVASPKFQEKQSTFFKDGSPDQSIYLDEKKIDKLGPKKRKDSFSEEKAVKVSEHKKTKKKLLRSNFLKKDQTDSELGRKETMEAKEVQDIDTKPDDNYNVAFKKKRLFKESSDSKEKEISGDTNKVDDLTQEGIEVKPEKHKKRKKLPNYALFEEGDPKQAKGHDKSLIKSDKKGKIENENFNDKNIEKKSPEKNKNMKEETIKTHKQNITIDQIEKGEKGKIENERFNAGNMEKKSPEKNKNTKEETIKTNKQNITIDQIEKGEKGKMENERFNAGNMEKKSPEKNKNTKEETIKTNKQNIDQIMKKKIASKNTSSRFSHELSESPFFLREKPKTGKNLLAKKNKLGKKLQFDSDRKLRLSKTKRSSSSVSKDSGVTISKRKGRDSESEGSEKPLKKLKKGGGVTESELLLPENAVKQTGFIGESNEASEHLQETKMTNVVDVINSEHISSDTESPDDNIRLIDLVVSKETKENDQDIDVDCCKKDDTATQECTAQSSSAFNDNPYISDISDAENVDEDEVMPKERMTNDMFRVNIFNQGLNQVSQQLPNTEASPEAELKPEASFNDGSVCSNLASPVSSASDVTNQEAEMCSPLAKSEQTTDVSSSDDKKAIESPNKPEEINDFSAPTEFSNIDDSNSVEINPSSSVRIDDELTPLTLDTEGRRLIPLTLDTVKPGSSEISEGTVYSSNSPPLTMKPAELKQLKIEDDLELDNTETGQNDLQSNEDNKTTTKSDESVCKGNLDDMSPSACYSTKDLDTKKGALAAISGYSSGEDEPSEDPCGTSVLELTDSQACHSEFEIEGDSKRSLIDGIVNDPGPSSPLHPEIKTEAVLGAKADSGSEIEESGTASNAFPSLEHDTNDALQPISEPEVNLPVVDMEELATERDEVPTTGYVATEDQLREEENILLEEDSQNKLRDENSQNKLKEEDSQNKLCDEDSQNKLKEEDSQNKLCDEDSQDVLFEEELSKSETAADDSLPVTEKESSSDSEDFGISRSYKPLPVIPSAVSCKEALSSIDGCREGIGTGTLERIVKPEDSDDKMPETLLDDEDPSIVKSKPLTDDSKDAETIFNASFGSKSGVNEGLNVANDATSMDTPELNVNMNEKHSLQNVNKTESVSKQETVCEVSRETVNNNITSYKTINNDIVRQCPTENVGDQDSMQNLADVYMPNLFDKFGKEALRAVVTESLVHDNKDNSTTVVESSPVKTAGTSDDTFNATAGQTTMDPDKVPSGDSSKLGRYEKEETNDGREENIKHGVNLLATDIDHDLHLGPFHGTKFEESDVDLKELSHPEEALKMLTEGIRLHKADDSSVSTNAKDCEQTTLSGNIDEIPHVKRTYLTELSEEDKHIVNMSMEIAEKMNSSDVCGHIENCLVNTDHADPVGGFEPGREVKATEHVDSSSKADLDEGKAADSASDVPNISPGKSVEKPPVADHRTGEQLAAEIERIKRNQSAEKPSNNTVDDSRTSQEITTQDKEIIDKNNEFSLDKVNRSNGARTVDIEPRGVPRVVADIDLHPITPCVSDSSEQQRQITDTAESSTVNKDKLPQAAKADDYDNAASNLDAASNKLGALQDNRMSEKNGKHARSASPNVPSRWREALLRSHVKLQPQIPSSYHTFSMFTGKYLLEDTEDTQGDDDNVDELKEMQQQHIVELEKLHIAMEQELLRVENKVQHASSNKKPISACSAVMYQTLEQFAKLGTNCNVQSNNDARNIDQLRKSWIQEVLEKYTKLEERVISRQKKEMSCLEQQMAFDKLHILGRKEVLRRKYLAGH